MNSIPHFLLAMIGLIVLFIAMCIRNEYKAARESKKPTPSQGRDVSSQLMIELLEERNKKAIEAGKRKHEEIMIAIDVHNEMSDAVKFTQNLINEGL